MNKKILILCLLFLVSLSILLSVPRHHHSTPKGTGLGEREKTQMLNGTRCGVERWPVKTLSDPLSSSVNLTPVKSRVVDLVKLPPPQLPSDNTTRLSQEMTTYLISGTRLTGYKLEGDSDYHLILTSPLNGATMIVEIPDPSCVTNSITKAKIANARTAFNSEVGVPTTSFTQVKKSVALTGVLFFDFLHGQTGVAPNAVELHPVLSFRVLTQ